MTDLAVVEVESTRTVVVETGDPESVVVVVEPDVQVVEVGLAGPQGPPGPQGPSGTGTTFVHEQAIPATDWPVTHNLGKFPSVSVVDSSNRWVVGSVTYVDDDHVVLHFAAAFSGKAYLN